MTIQPNSWSCLPTAFAIALGCLPADIFDFLGHDGSEILWPELDDPQKRRSFHPQEMIDYSWMEQRVIACTLEMFPCAQPEEDQTDTVYLLMEEADAQNRMMAYLANHSGVLGGRSSQGNSHAVAWDCKRRLCIDPRGDEYTLELFGVSHFYAFF